MIDCTFEDWVDVGRMSSEMFLDLARAYPKKLNRPKRRHLLKTFIGVQLGAHISELHDQGDCHDWITAEEVSFDQDSADDSLPRSPDYTPRRLCPI